MKKIIKKHRISLTLLMFVFLIMGNPGYADTTPANKKTCGMDGLKLIKSEPGKSTVYVSTLHLITPFSEPDSKVTESQQFLTDFLESIWGITPLVVHYFRVNAKGHDIENKTHNAQKFFDIIFDLQMTKKEKTEKVIADLMEPNGIDIIFSSKIIENKQNHIFSIRMLLVSRNERKILVESLQFKRDELFISDSQSQELYLRMAARDRIINGISSLVQKL